MARSLKARLDPDRFLGVFYLHPSEMHKMTEIYAHLVASELHSAVNKINL